MNIVPTGEPLQMPVGKASLSLNFGWPLLPPVFEQSGKQHRLVYEGDAFWQAINTFEHEIGKR